MSKHECPVVRVTIETHPNADAIELARVGGYVSIVKKGEFRNGDLAVYIPEQSLIPQWMLRDMGFWDDMNGKGRLSGGAGNRVKAIKLRGVLSQGLLYGGNSGDDVNPESVIMSADRGLAWEGQGFTEGQDAAEFLGVTKYEPAVPTHMQGRVAGGDLDATIDYDFDNIKKVPHLFSDDMDVVLTEKIHGTLLQVGIIPKRIWEGKSWAEKCPDVGFDFKGIVTSKGLGGKGLLLDPSDFTNLYVEMVSRCNLYGKLAAMRMELGHPDDMPLYVLGEIYGKDIQDLEYGVSKTFCAFDIYAGTRSNGFFLNWDLFVKSAVSVDIRRVPVLFRGKFDMTEVLFHTKGDSTLAPGQMREGCVIKSTAGGEHPKYGRRIAKSINEKYLLRKDATEFT